MINFEHKGTRALLAAGLTAASGMMNPLLPEWLHNSQLFSLVVNLLWLFLL